MKISIIGLGLIGGSVGIKLKQTKFAEEIIGVDANVHHTEQALTLGLIDKVMPLEESVKNSDLILLAIPVDASKKILPGILDTIKEGAVVLDMGSTKEGICEIADQHPNRNQFVASHPIAGTENSGPTAAFDGLFDNKIAIICDRKKSRPDAVALVERLYKALNMKLTTMESHEHDLHIAYVSHLSHVSSFMLGTTVLDKEKDEKNIFTMAGSGFESTVRLAKSSPDMWGPIFDQNGKNLSKAIGSYIENLKVFKQMIDNKETEKLHKLMTEANEIRRVLDGIGPRGEKLVDIVETNGKKF